METFETNVLPISGAGDVMEVSKDAEDGTPQEVFDTSINLVELAHTLGTIRRQQHNLEDRERGINALGLLNRHFCGGEDRPKYCVFRMPVDNHTVERFVAVARTRDTFVHGCQCRSKQEARASAAVELARCLKLDHQLNVKTERRSTSPPTESTPLYAPNWPMKRPFEAMCLDETPAEPGAPPAPELIECTPAPEPKRPAVEETHDREHLSGQTLFLLASTSKNPVMLLNECLAARKSGHADFEVRPEGSEFVAACNVQGQAEQVRGLPCRSKVLAKRSAARLMLDRLVNEGFVQVEQKETKTVTNMSMFNYLAHPLYAYAQPPARPRRWSCHF